MEDWKKELESIDTTGTKIKISKGGGIRIVLDRRVTGIGFKQTVNYLYTDRVSWDNNTDVRIIQETREAAEYLQLPRLVAICDSYLDKSKNVIIPHSTWWKNMKFAFDQLRVGKYSLSDFVLVIDGEEGEEEVPCHAVILTSASQYFNDLLLGPGDNEVKKTMRVKIDNATKSQLYSILRYIYCREFIVSVQDVVSVWVLSNRFIMEDLKVECESMIQINLTVGNAADIKRLAEGFNSFRIVTLCNELLGL